MFETDFISSVEKNYFIHDDFVCVWPHGFKYHHFDKLVPSFQLSEVSFRKVFFTGDF